MIRTSKKPVIMEMDRFHNTSVIESVRSSIGNESTAAKKSLLSTEALFKRYLRKTVRIGTSNRYHTICFPEMILTQQFFSQLIRTQIDGIVR